MDRVVRLYQIWNWLPHFRAVAETEHLPTASEALGLSTSALSRALKQLEAAVGRDLFLRSSRAIRLNSHGQDLLRAVRLAMRGIDDTLQSFDTTPIRMRVAAPGPFHGPLFLGLIHKLAQRQEQVNIELCTVSSGEMVAMLCRGDLDLCVHEGVVVNPDVYSRELGACAKVVACSPKHPLANQKVALAELTKHRFAAPPKDAAGIRGDGWPVAVERLVSLTVHQMQTGIDACRTGSYLIVLPQILIEANQLCEVAIDDLEATAASLFVTTRVPTAHQPPAIDRFVEDLTQYFNALD